jgi:DNA (cytosine-5)-methyltransferase 1
VTGSTSIEAKSRSGYGVKLVRGPFVRLTPNPDACTTEDELRALSEQLVADAPDLVLAADLFCGAGGLSLGLERSGFRVVLSVDHDAEAVETHRHLFAGLTADWDMSTVESIERVAGLMRENRIEVLAGGPPCQPFSKAGRSIIRHRVRSGLRPPHDERRDLWQSFLEVVRLAEPRAVIMENVPDMALDREMFILRTMVHELEGLGYGVEEKLIDTWRYGVAQFRQRLILVALKGDIAFRWPAESADNVTVWNAIGDLPEVEGGWRPAEGAEGWIDYPGPITTFQQRMRQGVRPKDASKVFDHITRPVREDDLRAFQLMDSDTRYSQLPEEMKRYRDDIFDDKYKRLDEDDLSRTITAHIAKDGYWYIHPRQDRTLTIREAARLQTFPDHVRFAGPPSAAFRQVGNAVPPLLAEHLGNSLMLALQAAVPRQYNTQDVAGRLAGWITAEPPRTHPWLAAESRWQVVAAELLLDRAPVDQVRYIWPLIKSWHHPQDVLANAGTLREIAHWIARERRAEQVLETAAWLVANSEAFGTSDGLARAPHITRAIADLAVLAVASSDGIEGEEPVLVTKGVLRVAARFSGDAVDRRNRLSDGRLGIARMIGLDANARLAHLAIMELASTLCRPTLPPKCGPCPLSDLCEGAASREPH